MKPAMSRFPIHDELTAPDGSVAVLRGALATAGQLPNFLGVLAGSPATLRGYARFRAELRRGHLTPPTLERIALGVAQHHGSQPGLALHARIARSAGLSFDEVALARELDSRDAKEAALLRLVRIALAGGTAPAYVHEEAREAGWSDEEMLEALAYVALESFTAMVHVVGDVPADGSVERGRQLRAA